MARMMVGRAVINLINDGLKMQEVQVTLLADEVRADVERFQEYGFTSHPVPGAEAVMVCVGGSRDHGIVIAVDDRRYRLKSLPQGEVALYDDQGQAIHLKRDKTIHVYGCDQVQVDAAVKVVTTAPEYQVNSSAINLADDRGSLRALIDERLITLFNNHTHSGFNPDRGAPLYRHSS
jgi:phage baseplate assembly protein V